MCKDLECPSRLTCFRFVAKPQDNQSYFIGSPRYEGERECPWYLEATCCLLSHQDWSLGEESGTRRECLYCNQDWQFVDGKWRKVEPGRF